MQALILVGGEGTRLRPLTSEVPKPVVTLVDRPFLAFMLEWLASHGVDDVVMSCGFKADKVRAVLGDGSAYGVRIRYAEEPRPLGTGGALKFCEDLLDERFLMLNGDVLSDIDLTAQIAQHEATGATGTLALVAVADPSNYGLVRTDAESAVLEFIEKPEQDVGVNTISAGAYVLERSVLDLLQPDTQASIEREVFPRLVGNGLHARVSDGYWLDIGTPDRYLQGTFDILEGTVATRVQAPGGLVQGAHCRIEGEVLAPAVLGDDVIIGRGSVVERAVILDSARIGADCVLRDCIVVPGAIVADGVHAEPGAILA
jgi:mannose-1-phosphate guanylyltransferase